MPVHAANGAPAAHDEPCWDGVRREVGGRVGGGGGREGEVRR